jgi:basic membrane protein A
MKKSIILALLIPAILLAGCQKKAPAKAPEAVTKYKVGIVFDVGGKGDKSFNDSAYNGLKQLAETYKGYIKDDPDKVDFGKAVELKYLEPKQGGQDREQLLRVLAEEGYNLIFGVGFMFTDSIVKVAKDFPKVHFGLIDGWAPDLKDDSNLTCLAFAEEQGSFLVGALSGLMVADKPKAKVGFIGGMDMPLIHKFQAGFNAGAAFVNVNLRKSGMVLGQYIGKDGGAFNDPKTAASIASNMYKGGAEIVYHAAGGSGTGLFETAKNVGKLAIGVDSDQGLGYSSNDKDPAAKEIGKFIITSMLKRVDQSVFLTAKVLIDGGKVKGGYRNFQLADNGVGYALNDFNKDKLGAYTAKLDELKAKIVSGEIKVPADDAAAAEFVKALK